MIEESRPQPRSRVGRSKRFRTSHAFISLATALGLVFGGLVLATPGQADQEEQSNGEGASETSEDNAQPTEESGNDRVCDGLSSGKIETPNGPKSVTISAPDGYVIVEYCVKAGPEAQYDDVDRVPSLTIFGPDGKDISHYSFAYEPAPSGELELVKSLIGGPGDYTELFTIEYSCSMGDATGESGSEEIAAGASAMVRDIPAGSECVVSEPSLPIPPTGYSFGKPSFVPSGPVKITSGETTTVTTENSLEQNSGSLQILKELENPDEADVPETFTIGYECAIDGTVTKSGSEDVAPGMTGVTVSGISTGSTCTITEQELTPIDGYTWDPVSYAPESVEITSPDETYIVKAVNEISEDQTRSGVLELTKELIGGPGDYTELFTIEYSCSMGDATGESGSEEIAGGDSAQVTNIPAGSECVVSEPSLPIPPTGYSFGQPSFVPSGTVKIISGETTTVTTENTLTRDEGNLRITKSLTGTPADYDPEFDVSYVCTSEGEDTISGSTTVSNDEIVEVPAEGSIPTGYQCTVTEGALPTLPAGYTWDAPEYTNNQESDPGNVVTIVENNVTPTDQGLPVDQMATVNIANSATFSSVPVVPASGDGAGALTVSKTFNGAPAGFSPAFSIAWFCSGTTGSISGQMSLAAGESATVFSVPNGYSCSVSESDLPTAPTGFTWETPSITGSPTPAIADNSTVSVSVVNSLVAEEATPVEPASPVTPVEPASPVTPVEPASPVTPEDPVAVGPAGVPTVVPAGGGAAINAVNGQPVALYIVIVLGIALAIAGAAYLIRQE